MRKYVAAVLVISSTVSMYAVWHRQRSSRDSPQATQPFDRIHRDRSLEHKKVPLRNARFNPAYTPTLLSSQATEAQRNTLDCGGRGGIRDSSRDCLCIVVNSIGHQKILDTSETTDNLHPDKWAIDVNSIFV